MSALAFDPWAALAIQRQKHPLPNPAKAPNVGELDADGPADGLAVLGALGGGCPALARNDLAAVKRTFVPFTSSPTQSFNVKIRQHARTVNRQPRASELLDLCFIPGVPAEWFEGVRRLANRLAPDGIGQPRWMVFQASAARLLRDSGAELHALSWGTLDVFGLHADAPASYPPGWGLAWLLGAGGQVLDITPNAIGMTREPNGARLAFYRRHVQVRGGVLPAWNLPEMLK